MRFVPEGTAPRRWFDVYRNESSRLIIRLVIPLSLPYRRELEDFDTGNWVAERTIKLLCLRFRWRAAHITGKRAYWTAETGHRRLALLEVIANGRQAQHA